MIKRYSNEQEGLTVEDAPGERSRQGGAALLPERRHPTDLATHSAAKPVTAPPPVEAGRVDWNTVLVWSFVLCSFAGMFFAFYQIWARCRGN